MDYLDSFGEWMRKRREALRLTRSKLAECVGCSVSALRKIEADERRPSRQLAELLAACLRIPPQQQLLFLDAARGVRRVARLGLPAARPSPLPSTPPRPSSGPAASAPPAAPDWNLPAPATPLIGREMELATLMQLLSDPGCRLLTLVGPGGIGKTRLAIEAACYVWERFAGGVHFASLASIRSSEHLVPTVAQAVGLNFAGPADPRHQLVNYLGNKRMLLLLDNFEHFPEGVELLIEIFERAPGVKLLVTSRERLELQVEWVFEVQGLPVPNEGELDKLENYSAVQLFLQRARQARIGFQLATKDRPHVVRICRLVEGLPLAIELAATWIPVLSCREIAVEIERSIDFLTAMVRDVPDRQRSIRAVFDHSWKLLSEEEKQVLRRMSVFCGGFTRQAAKAVAGAGLPLLSALVASSFLRRTSMGRFTMHELMRQYLAARLAEEPEEEMVAQDRHSAYFTDLVSQLEGELKRAHQLEALAEMDVEIDNIRTGWRWAVRRGNLAATRKPMRALLTFYDIRGWFHEANASFCWAAEELERTLVAEESVDEAVVVSCACARVQQGWFCLRTGKFEEAEQLLKANLDILRASGAYVEMIDALQHAGALDRLLGQYALSRVRYEEMLQYALQTGDPWDVAVAECSIGMAAQALGDYEEAQERMAATVTAFRTLGDRRMLAVALHFLGSTTGALRSYDEAQAYLHESLTLSRFVGDRWIEAMALREMGNVAQRRGAHAEAVSLFRESLLLAREIGEHWSILQALTCLGAAMLALGDYNAAHAAFHEGLAMAWELQTLPGVLAALAGLTRWSVRQGTGDEMQQAALTSILFVLDHPATSYKTKDDALQLRSELEAQLQPAEVAGAQQRAQHLSLESLVESTLARSPE